jgi:protein TonB
MNNLLFTPLIAILLSTFMSLNTRLTSKNNAVFNSNFQQLTPPEFPGGEQAFHQYLNKNINWPIQKDIQGTIIISFFVERDGYLTGFKVEKGVEKSFDAEALRVVMKSPRWIPAMRNGKPIKSKYTVPIKYQVNNETVTGN